jgi:hypothetical protein
MSLFQFPFVAIVAIATLIAGLAPANAQSRVADSNNVYASVASTANTYSKPAVARASESMVLTGKITNAAGVLPGAVIILTANKHMAVTNADGEFEIEVPADSGPLQARVTYGGYADESMVLNAGEALSTVNLANATVIVVARRQRLKAYLKTARKQVRHELKQIHAK